MKITYFSKGSHIKSCALHVYFSVACISHKKVILFNVTKTYRKLGEFSLLGETIYFGYRNGTTLINPKTLKHIGEREHYHQTILIIISTKV